MKNKTMLMTAAFALAIGAAFAGKANSKLVLADSEQLISGTCQKVTTGCNNTGPNACGVVAYKIPSAGQQDCSILLQFRN